jgi:O-antigen/teichoic acid export membrane protein
MATVFGLTLLACAGYVIWTILLVGDALTSEIASWLVLWVFLAPPVVMVYARFQLLHDVWWMVAWPLLQLVPRVLVTTLAVFVGAPLWLIPAGFVVVLAPMSMYAWRLIRLMGAPEFSRIFHRNKRMRDSQLPATPRSLLKRTWAYGASEVLENIDLKLIIPLTAAIAGERHTGYLSTVVIVLTAMHIVPWAVVQRYFLSRLHQLGVQAPRQLRWYMKRVALLLALVGLMAAPMVWYWSDEIVYLVYGEKYVPSGEVLRALSFAIPVWLLSLPVASMFLAVHMIKRLVISQMLALIILVLAGLQFIPEYGAVGAAWALLAGRVGLLVIAGTWLWLVGPNQK